MPAPEQIPEAFSTRPVQSIKADRTAWALSRARMGYTAREIGEALGISICTVSVMLRAAGNNWFDQPRSIRDPRWRKDLRERAVDAENQKKHEN